MFVKFQMSIKNPPDSDASGFFVGIVDFSPRVVVGTLVVATVVLTAAATVVVVLVVASTSCLGAGVDSILMMVELLPSVSLVCVISTINYSPSMGSILFMVSTHSSSSLVIVRSHPFGSQITSPFI